jgi:gluconolactonase
MNPSPLAGDILLGGSMTKSPKSSWVISAALLTAACSKAPAPAPALEKAAAVGSITRLDAALDALVPKDAQIEKLAGGFTFTEGPLWRPNGVLWYSDVVGNVVRQWSPDGKVIEILKPGGYDGNRLPVGGFNGPMALLPPKTGLCCCASMATAASFGSAKTCRSRLW